MQRFRIQTTNNTPCLYEGHFKNFTACLEQAVAEGIPLPYADLRQINLLNANLDQTIMPHADFSGANLNGANLSEANLENSLFINSTLYDCCLCESNLNDSNFEGAGFGATNITGTRISRARFSTLSCFSLDFTHVAEMEKAIFINPDGRISPMSHPPIVIKGLASTPLILMDQYIKCGQALLDYPNGEKLNNMESIEEAV